ncbi:hypothetical protein V2J09_022219 [Rumex salicifolius]
MARKKVQLAYIACDTARKSTFKKRKKGLLKKIDELTTLCGVEACAVMYNPYDPEPVVWPEKEKAQKMYDHPSYLKQRVIKATQQLTRLHRYNCEREVALAMYGCLAGRRTLDGLNPLDLHDLGLIVERTIKEISLRLENPRRDKAPPQVVAQDSACFVAQPPPPLSSDFFGMRVDEEGSKLGNYLRNGIV